MSELQDMLANTFKMERGKKSDKKWRDAHTFKAEQEKLQAKETAEYVERNRLTAAKSIADMAESTIGSITKFRWDIAVTRIGQLASDMNVSMGGQSVGGRNGNADELTNWDGTKKRGLGR